MNKKRDYFGFVFILILVCFLVGIFFSNPHFFSKVEFNKTFQNTQSDINLETKGEIMGYIERGIMNLPGDVLVLKQNGQINSTQEQDIIQALDRASSEFSDYKTNLQEENLYQSLFYSQASLAYYKAYPFINCANEISAISNKYTPFFYYLSHSDRERVFDILGTSSRLNNYLDYNSNYVDNKDIIVRRAREVFTIEQDFDFYKLKCEEFNIYLKKDYTRQKLLAIFKGLIMVGLFISGFILGKVTKFLKKVNLGKGSFFERFSKFFFPEKIENETIERLLKTTTILAVFGALGSAFIVSDNVLIKLLGIFAIVDVLVFLMAIAIGISALNNSSEKGKRLSYCLYSIGIISFIGIVIYFFVLFFLGKLFSTAKLSLQTFLNNQTGVK